MCVCVCGGEDKRKGNTRKSAGLPKRLVEMIIIPVKLHFRLIA